MRKIDAVCGKPYEILIERGLLNKAGRLLKSVLRADKLFVVTDSKVDGLYADALMRSLGEEYSASALSKYALPEGEKNKTPQEYLKLVDAMAKSKLSRSDAVIALGGGVVGDVAGFAAATYMRGIDVVQIPTTLLAMIDSSVGGKTGVDLPDGKNLLGAFHSPKVVFIDPDVLNTLDEEQYRNGLGEGIKYAVIDPTIAPYLKKNREETEEFVASCVALKAEIVRRDEFEGNIRRLLNLGHTVGHALEAASGFELSHGIAVAQGISVMTSAALKAGEISKRRADDIFGLLELVGVGETRVCADEISTYLALDKKADGKEINAVAITQNGVEIRKFAFDKFLHYVSKINFIVQKSTLKGQVCAPISKSLAHRVLIASYLADDVCDVDGGEDIAATKRCLCALQAAKENENPALLDVGESGSTLRFLLPVVCALGIPARFVGEGRIGQRPLSGLLDVLESHGAVFTFETDENIPLEARGKLRAGEYSVDGGVSSQYVTGLLFALPLLDGDSVLTVRGKAASSSYIRLTLDVLERFGVKIERDGNRFNIAGGQKFVVPEKLPLEGDWSSAGFLLAAGALAGETQICGLDENSAQGDKIVVELLKRAGADISFKDGKYIARRSEFRAIDFDAADCPDVVPILATALSFADGVSRISSVDRLKDKESDRLKSIIALVESFGAEAAYDGKVLTIFGKRTHKAGEYPSCDDHRIAMSATVAALATDGECVVRGAECIDKSYPAFYRDMLSLGANIKTV